MIPMMASVGMIRTLAMVLGPSVLGLLGADSGTIRILTMVGEAGIASLPVFVAWSVSGYLKTDTVLALFYGAFLAYPALAELLSSGESVTLFCLPVPAATYTSQVVPMMLIMLAMYLVERLLKRLLAEDGQFMAMPILETITMLPLTLCVIGPLGTILGTYLSKGVMAFCNPNGNPRSLRAAFFVPGPRKCRKGSPRAQLGEYESAGIGAANRRTTEQAGRWSGPSVCLLA